MALVLEIIPHTLIFKFAARTSRGPISNHHTWLLRVWDDQNPSVVGYGECAPFEGISLDHSPDYEQMLRSAINLFNGKSLPNSLAQIDNYVELIDIRLPSVRFGLETALRDLFYGGQQRIFEANFYDSRRPIDINGLVWMGAKEEMLERLELKAMAGFDCIKLKIGALDFDEELEVIKAVRNMTNSDNLTLRVDANGAYSLAEVDSVLELLAKYHIHSIEQPVKTGQIEAMRQLCAKSPVAIALDEELVSITEKVEKEQLLATIRPQYIVLKPTLLGGFKATHEWINIAERLNIGWWITSALESNIGLNAICQFTSQFDTMIPQGLGTGDIYTNNIPSPLSINNGCVYWDDAKSWEFSVIDK
jgi:o-succinylbenzoate synthase